ncbi:MAG: HEAT repeat domain-containing protein [Dehalococcoidia bacterium]
MVNENILKHIEDGKMPVASLDIASLSDLDIGSANKVSNTLSTLELEREIQILDHLLNVSEDRFDVNFDEIFINKLNSDREEIREISIRGLWEYDERTLIEPLLEKLTEDDSTAVRIAAAIGIRRFSILAEEGKLLDRDSDKIYETLQSLIDDDHSDIQEEIPVDIKRRIIEALSPYNTPEIHDIILDNYHSLDERLRASAIFSMGENGDSDWIPYILDEMDNSNPEIRFEAAGAAGRIGDESLIPDLARMGNDDSFEVVSQVITALNLIGGSNSIKVLTRFLQHENNNVRSVAQDALENMEKEQLSIEEISKGNIYEPFSSPGEELDEIFSNFDEGLEDID